jgi:hypothetical protein
MVKFPENLQLLKSILYNVLIWYKSSSSKIRVNSKKVWNRCCQIMINRKINYLKKHHLINKNFHLIYILIVESNKLSEIINNLSIIMIGIGRKMKKYKKKRDCFDFIILLFLIFNILITDKLIWILSGRLFVKQRQYRIKLFKELKANIILDNKTKTISL